MTSILGVSAYYHDSAACLVKDGKVFAAAQEERFSRKKHDAGFPSSAIRYCLSESNLKLKEIDHVVFYDKPFIKFERLLETYLAKAPQGFSSFIKSMPIWLKEKLYLKTILKQELIKVANINEEELPKLLFSEHHKSHAASAFYPSPFERAAILCLDGVGEWATTSVWLGEANKIKPQWQIDFPHSLGLLYSAFTYFTGFKVNSGEYKLMGLAPYGEPRYVDTIFENLLDLKDDGTFRLDMSYFNYLTGLTMTNNNFSRLFDGPPRDPETEISQREMDIAASIQIVLEEIVLRLARTIKKELGMDYLCLAGGVALNCVVNGKLSREKIFKDIWIQPAAGDAGGAIGAALSDWYEYLGNNRRITNNDTMSGAYLGPRFNNESVKRILDNIGASYSQKTETELISTTAKLLSEAKIVGWFQGRMEFGPRALGNRSILGDPRNPEMQKTMNLKIKYRESFRPFAPSILEEQVNEYFNIEHKSPYMLFVADIKQKYRLEKSKNEMKLFGIDKLNEKRSKLPAITHVDYSARIQTVNKKMNARYYKLINEFSALTGFPVLINTSFNIRGEPIVCTPIDAYRCFMRTEMDYLVIEDFILEKKNQPDFEDKDDWLKTSELD